MMNQQLRQIIGVFFVFILRWINAGTYSKMVHEIELEIIVSQETISNYPWSDYEDRSGATNNPEIQGLFKRDLEDAVDQANWLFDNTFNDDHRDGVGFKLKINKIYFDDTPVSRNWLDSLEPRICHRHDASRACWLARDEPQRIITRDICAQYINPTQSAPGSVCIYLQPDKPHYFSGDGKAFTTWGTRPGQCAEQHTKWVRNMFRTIYPNDIINKHSLRTAHNFRMIWMQFSPSSFGLVQQTYTRSKYKGYLFAHEIAHTMGILHNNINLYGNGVMSRPRYPNDPVANEFIQHTKDIWERYITSGWFQCLNQIQITTDDEDTEDYLGNVLLPLTIDPNYTGLRSRQLFN